MILIDWFLTFRVLLSQPLPTPSVSSPAYFPWETPVVPSSIHLSKGAIYPCAYLGAEFGAHPRRAVQPDSSPICAGRRIYTRYMQCVRPLLSTALPQTLIDTNRMHTEMRLKDGRGILLFS